MNKNVSITAVQVTFVFGIWENLNSYHLIDTLKRLYFFLNAKLPFHLLQMFSVKPLN